MAKSMEGLKREVQEAEQEVLLTTGEALRIAAGESRLKEKARDRVAQALQNEGLLAVPDVPGNQGDEVYLTSSNSEFALLFRALESPNQDSLDRRILPAVGSAGPEAERWEAIEELGELLHDARDLVTKIEGGGEEDRRAENSSHA